jgi:CRP-like cAMP-binding protein
MKENSNKKRIDIYVEKFKRYFHQNTILPAEVIDAVVNVCKPRKYKKGEIFAKQDEFSDHLGYIYTGIFSVTSTQKDGTLFVANFLKEGDFVQGSFDSSLPGTLTIQALCDTVVFEAKKKVIHDMYLQYPQLGNLAQSIVEKYLISYTSHMIQIGTKKAQDRYLLFRDKFPDDEERIPQHLIAAYLGVTPTQLSRIRKKIAGEKQVPKNIVL